MLKFDFLRLLRFMFPLRVSEEARNKFLFGHTNHLLACAQIFISFLFFILYIYIFLLFQRQYSNVKRNMIIVSKTQRAVSQ